LEQVRQSEALAKSEKSAILPSVSFQARQGRAKSSFGIPDFETGEGFVESIHFNSFEAKLQGLYTFFDPVAIATFLAAKQGVKVAEFEYRTALQETLFGAGRLFFLHQRDLAREAVVAANIERSQVALEQAEARFEAGVGPEIDVTRAKAQLARDQQQALEQDAVSADSGYALRRVLNFPLDESLYLIDHHAEIDVGQDADSLVETALRERSEFQQEQNQLERNALETKAAKYKRLPSLSLSGEFGYIGQEALDGNEQETWMVGVAVEVPIFESGNIAAAKSLAASRLREQEFRIRSKELEIEAEVRFALKNLDSAIGQAEAARIGKDLAEDEMRLAQARYEEGIGDNRELIDAKTPVEVVVVEGNRIVVRSTPATPEPTVD